MAIDSSKILTISARDYLGVDKSIGRDYDVAGVHSVHAGDADDTFEDGLEGFCNMVPDGTEVVVDFRTSVSNPTREVISTVVFFSGTALVPKKY